MLYKQIIATPAVTLREMSYETFVEMFNSCTSELEILEAAQSHEIRTSAYIQRAAIIAKLTIAKENLTLHRHYDAYCAAQDRRFYDSVYHTRLSA
ncbi:MAG: hypothetical protein JWM28_4495 [Chitinophagaceae bacterium]|nr:hypothetical protein [Chitinophagaceae bacterium]